MKRLILPLFLLLLCSPGFTQIVDLSGTVTDSATGAPIPGQAVQILSDSSAGFIYFNTVYTDLNGNYQDSIPVNSFTTGVLYVTTIDCLGNPVTYNLTYNPANMNLVQDFQICSGSPCQASFSYANTLPLTIQFTDASTGTTGPWLWQFGDGASSAQQNPAHTYIAGGYYNVSLTIGDSATSCWDMILMTVYVIDSTAGGCTAWFNYIVDPPNGNTVYFLDASIGNISTWSWNFDDPASGNNNTSTLPNPSHTFSAAGTYDVCLTITGLDSVCYDTYCLQITVGNTPGGCQADFYYYPDSTVANTTYQFVDQSTGNISSWSWDFGDGTTSSLQNPVHVFTAPGFYNVCLMVQGVDSLCYDTNCELVNVGGGSGCQAQFTYYPDSAWNARLIHFMDLSTGDITDWFWDFGDSTFSTEQNPSHIFPENGTFYVCLTITGYNSGAICQSTWCEEVTVGPGSDCASYFTFQKNGLAVSFTGHMVNGQPATYYWDFGDGQSGQGQNVIHQYPVSGIYYATLTTVTTNPVMCTFSTSQSITVGDSTQWNQIYGQVFAGNFPLTSGMVMIFSLDTTAVTFVPFIDISLVDSSGVYYFPMVPLGNYVIYAIPFIPTGYLPTYYGDVLFWENATVVALGQANNPYNINLIQADSYNSGVGGINGQIYIALKSFIVDKITMLLMNEAGQGISYHQVDVNGQFDFSELDYGIYYLKGEIAGCQSDYIKVELTPEKPVVDVIMTMDGNQLLGTPEVPPTLDAGVVYPNPVFNEARISVKLTEAAQVYIELYNLPGQRVHQGTYNLNAGSTTISVPVGHLRDGLYTLRMYTGSGINITRKLLKSQ